MSEQKQKTPWSGNYHNIGYDEESKKDRWARVKTRVGKAVLAVAAGAGLWYGGEAIQKSERADAIEEVKSMNERFEPILKPAAQEAAKFALDKVTQFESEKEKGAWDKSKGSGSVGDNPSDPTEVIVNYERNAEGGRYRIKATMDKGIDGKPDVSRVESVELWEEEKKRRNSLSSEMSLQ